MSATPQWCANCAFLEGCGGLDQQSLFGCFSSCSGECRTQRCDYVCPFGRDFAEHVAEVGGLGAPSGLLRPASSTPLEPYVPIIQHGSSRSLPFDWPVVGISIARLFRRGRRPRLHGGGDPIAFRRALGLSDNTRIMIVSVAHDAPLERYWALPNRDEMAHRLARLNVFAMTLPNYSFFRDAPRTHTQFQRRRQLIVGDELSRAGVDVIPHLNAITSGDWSYWRDLLLERTDVRVVVKEFQTGMRNRHRAEGAIRALAELQQAVGRDLHVLAVGGARHVRALQKAVAKVTIVDSDPFMKAMKRRAQSVVSGIERWRRSDAKPGIELSDLLAANVRAHDRWIRTQLGGAAVGPAGTGRYLRVLAG